MIKLSLLAPGIPSAVPGQAFNYINSGLSGNDIEVHNPHSTIKGDNIRMAPKQWLSTYDESFKTKNPAYAARHAYYNPDQTDRSMGFQVGQGLGSILDSVGPTAGKILNNGPLVGGLASVVPGALLGMLGTGAVNLISGRDLSDNVLRNSSLGGLLTGGLGAFSGYLRKYKPTFAPATPEHQTYTSQDLIHDREAQRQALAHIFGQRKTAGMKSMDAIGGGYDFGGTAAPQSKILQILQAAPGMSYTEKSQLTVGISRLSPQDLVQLANSLHGVTGAIAGAVIAKFLLNRGLIGTVMGAIFGGAVAKAVFGTQAKNALGQSSMQGHTITGNTY